MFLLIIKATRSLCLTISIVAQRLLKSVHTKHFHLQRRTSCFNKARVSNKENPETWTWLKIQSFSRVDSWQASLLNRVYLLRIKVAQTHLPSEQGSQPEAHTGTQRPPAKPSASLYSSILWASQSQQGAAAAEELSLNRRGQQITWEQEERDGAVSSSQRSWAENSFSWIDKLITASGFGVILPVTRQYCSKVFLPKLSNISGIKNKTLFVPSFLPTPLWLREMEEQDGSSESDDWGLKVTGSYMRLFKSAIHQVVVTLVYCTTWMFRFERTIVLQSPVKVTVLILSDNLCMFSRRDIQRLLWWSLS